MSNEGFEGSNSDPHGQLNFLDQYFQETVTSLQNTNTPIDIASQTTASRFERSVRSMPGAPALFLEEALQPQRNQSAPANSPESSQVNGHSEGALESTVMRFSTLPQPTMLPTQISMTPEKDQNPTLNADEKFICDHLGCSNIQFKRKCDWQ
jgi:hypothetical protein